MRFLYICLLLWDKKLVEATEDTTYTAVYTSTLINANKKNSSKDPNSASETVDYNNKQSQQDQTKKEDKNNYYWVNFLDNDGTSLQRTQMKYGTTPSCAAPDKKVVGNYEYTFNSWSPAIHTVTGTQTYTATYTEKYIGKTNDDPAPAPESTPVTVSTIEWE